MARKRIKKKTGSRNEPVAYKPLVGRLYLGPEADKEDALLLERLLSLDPDSVYTRTVRRSGKKGYSVDFRNENMDLHLIADKAQEYSEVHDYIALGTKISTLIEFIYKDKPNPTLLHEISERNNVVYFSVSKKPGSKNAVVKVGFSGSSPDKILGFVKSQSEEILSWNVMCQLDGSVSDSSEYGIRLNNKLDGAKELPKEQEGRLSLQRTYPLSGTEFEKSFLSIPGKKGKEIKQLKGVDVSDLKIIYPSLETYLKEDDFFELYFLDSSHDRTFRFGSGLKEKDIDYHIDSLISSMKEERHAPENSRPKRSTSRRKKNRLEIKKKAKKVKVPRRKNK